MATIDTYREHSYRSADGRLDLFARDYPASGDGEDLTPLLMMHGLTRNSADFEPLIANLAARDRRIIVPDQRGRGRSDNDPDPTNYRPDIYLADMWALLDELGIERVICVGTSMGGLMAMLMAAQEPSRIAGIVLNDVGPVVSEEGLDRIRSYVGPSEPMAGWDEAAAHCKAINASAMIGFSDDDWVAFAKRTCRELPNGKVEFAYDPAIAQGLAPQDTTAVPPDPWPLWEALRATPILAIRGELSDILSSSTVAEMSKRRDGNLATVEVPDRGHAPLLDEPEAVSAINAFIASVT